VAVESGLEVGAVSIMQPIAARRKRALNRAARLAPLRLKWG